MLRVKGVHKPASLSETLTLLGEDRWKILAGGTDVLPAIRDGRLQSPSLLDISALRNEWARIVSDADYLRIGSLVRIKDLVGNEDIARFLPTLAESCRQIGSRQIRNRATLGGNIVNASPAADSVPVLTAAKASLVLLSRGGRRVVDLAQFTTGPSHTVMAEDEFLAEILIPKSEGPWKGTYFKVGDRKAMTIAVVSLAILQNKRGGYRISCGSVNPTIRRAPAVEAIFNAGPGSDKKAIKEAVQEDTHPIDDVRASAQYRSDVLVNLLFNEYQGSVRR